MPHKHKRKADDDEEQFNLPPTVRAKPLLAGKAGNAPSVKKHKTQHVANYGADDTPKAFARLMAFHASSGKPRSGLDDGVRAKQSKAAKKKQQQQQSQSQSREGQSSNTAKDAAPTAEDQDAPPNSEAQPAQPPPTLKIMPGESLAEFRQRVNLALPLTGLAKSNSNRNNLDGMPDHRVTKHERKLKRLQDGWRKEEARLMEKEQEARELAEEDEDEANDLWEDRNADLEGSALSKKGKKRKAKRKLVVGEVDDGKGQEDEWEALRKKREERRGLHDVVQAPPTFTKVPREIFKVKDGARVNVGNVPKGAGSLRKREEMEGERQGIIETYRKLMAARR